MLFLDELHAEHFVLQSVDGRLADDLVRERVVEIARLRYDVLNLVVGGEQTGKGYEPARVRRLILLVEPQLVAQNFRARRPFLLVGLAELLYYLAYAVVYFAYAA